PGAAPAPRPRRGPGGFSPPLRGRPGPRHRGGRSVLAPRAATSPAALRRARRRLRAADPAVTVSASTPPATASHPAMEYPTPSGMLTRTDIAGNGARPDSGTAIDHVRDRRIHADPA